MKSKNKLFFLCAFVIAIFFNSCKPYIGINPVEDEEIIYVPETIEIEIAVDDPQQTGVACGANTSNRYIIEPFEIIEIPNDLSETYDLSEFMPPVRSQGGQGSCTAWATTYYLKSYQEKIQNGYEYLSYENVMSPAFVYNQVKANDNCGSGSFISDALELLRTQGCNNWADFPYSDATCSKIPSEELLTIAKEHKISDYFYLDIPEENTDPDYSMVNLIKTLVSQNNPIILEIDILNLIFENQEFEQEQKFIATSFSLTPDRDVCGHAVLVVGYNDQLNAFKFVNSWGSDWGNEGYAWINYNFFIDSNETNYHEGFRNAYITFDMEE